jgi:hypothetical protein
MFGFVKPLSCPLSCVYIANLQRASSVAAGGHQLMCQLRSPVSWQARIGTTPETAPNNEVTPIRCDGVFHEVAMERFSQLSNML